MSHNRSVLIFKILFCCATSVVSNSVSYDDSFSNEECNSFVDPPSPREVLNWPRTELKVGFVVAVAVNTIGNPVIFHRGEQQLNGENAFDANNYYNGTTTLILAPTILQLDAATGLVLSAHGARQFILPHGLTIDQHDRYWLTDAAMHQMLMYDRVADIDRQRPALVLGQRGQPGAQLDHLCKPTSVAVASNGEFYVSDGYCNSRVLKFDADGCLLHVFPQDDYLPFKLVLPHAVTLLESEDRMCISDRAQRQIVCPSLSGRREATVIDDIDLGHVSAAVADGPFVYAVNVPLRTYGWIPIRGVTIDTRSGSIVDRWGNFSFPHGLAIDANRSVLYVTDRKPYRLVKYEMDYYY